MGSNDLTLADRIMLIYPRRRSAKLIYYLLSAAVQPMDKLVVIFPVSLMSVSGNIET